MRRLLAGALLTLLPMAAAAQVQPFTSWRKLTSTNGFVPVVYDLEARRLTVFRENMYRYPREGVETRNLAFDMYLGLRVAGQSRWLTEAPLLEGGYEPGTNLIRTVQRVDDVEITTTYVAPFGIDAKVLMVVAELVNRGDAVSDVALFSLHNFHVGSGADGTTGERVVWDAARDAYLETGPTNGGAAGTLVITASPPPSRRTAGAANPFPLVQNNQLFERDVDDSTVMDDAVSGFQFDVNGRGALAAGARASFAIFVGWGDAGDVHDKIAAYTRDRTPQSMLQAEREAFEAWLAQGRTAAGTTPEEDAVARQSLAVLRMGQVREPGGPNGQLLASLPPGMWDIAWLRDGILAVRALVQTGHHDEAERALDFFIRGPNGEYASYIGRPYALTVARHYGSGREESDWNANGPNVELDGFGMYLEAAAQFVQASGRVEWLARNQTKINDGVADVLLHFRDPGTGLIAADSSIWESHWDNGGRQRWLFTSGMAVRGLRRWADVLDAHAGTSTRAAAYRSAASSILAGIEAHLVDPATGALASSVEQLAAGDGRVADAQAALILDPTTVTASSATGLATLDLLRERLFLSQTTRRGYKRNDDGDLYDEREWVVIDLAVAQALRAAGRASSADALIDWVTGQATANHLLIPELLSQDTAAYLGEVPMVGFGAGAYLMALIDRGGSRPYAAPGDADAGAPDTALDAGAQPEVGPDAPPTQADAGRPDDAEAPLADARSGRDAAAPGTPPDAGCGCQTRSQTTPAGLVLLFWLVPAVLRRQLR